MNNYKLQYSQPYEMDHDSGPGIGDHVIEHARQEITFKMKSDKEAVKSLNQFLKEGSIVFNHYLDGDGKTYFRKLLKLTRFKEIMGGDR